MDFREMTYIVTTADCKSVTEAAKKLYISQPSLSQIISKVENEAGVKFFDRTSFPITLTFAGERFYEAARKILHLNENLRKELIDIGEGKKGKISIGIPIERAGYMLPPALKEFKKIYPGVELRSVEAKTDLLLDLLKKGTVDFAILPGEISSIKLNYGTELIYKEELLMVASKGVVTPDMYYRGIPKTADLRLFGEKQFLQLKKGHAIRKEVDNLLKQNHIAPPVIMEIVSNITAVQLAASGYGLAIVPLRAVEVLGGRERFYCYSLGEIPYTWDVNVVYQKGTYINEAERCFIEMMKRIFKQEEMGNGEII